VSGQRGWLAQYDKMRPFPLRTRVLPLPLPRPSPRVPAVNPTTPTANIIGYIYIALDGVNKSHITKDIIHLTTTDVMEKVFFILINMY
jgi:hypothetical protein